MLYLTIQPVLHNNHYLILPKGMLLIGMLSNGNIASVIKQGIKKKEKLNYLCLVETVRTLKT